MLTELPTGTVTFLFTDIEGSTRLIEKLGEDGYVDALGEHQRVLRTAFAAHGGVEVGTQGDAFLYAFTDPGQGLAAAAQGQQALASGSVRVRMGLHTGHVRLTREGDDYTGREVHRAARIAATGHGGQVVVSAATRALVHGELMQLGEHRLKDFDDPVALYQLGHQRFPPLKTVSNTNLPRPASSFVGRQREREELVAMLSNGTRLVTLAGPGGSGKTRLAVEAATELLPRFAGGVFWVGLAPLRDSTLVLETIAQTLGAPDGLEEHIGERELLLLLDNLEQVIDGAPQLAHLLETCPNLRLLCTSRELLRVHGEVEYQVPPLASTEAVALFGERSGLESTAEIVELCKRLDDLPLAVELAAARTRALSPAQILERLSQSLDLLQGGRDADPRQQTLRATIAWSYELLTPEEQATLAKLAVFAGGCTLEAAEEICGADIDAIASMVDKSLIRHSGDRYWMLQTIREYAGELLEESGEADAVRNRHAEHYLALAELADAERFEQSPRRLEPENDNLRAALDHLQDRAPARYLQLAGALGEFWHETSQFAEGTQNLEHALASARDEGPHTARALAYLGQLEVERGQFSFGASRLEESIKLWRRIGDQARLLEVSNWLGDALIQAGDKSRALELFEQNLELARSLGDDTLFKSTLGLVCWGLLATGQFERAEPLAEELGNDHYLADCAQHRRDYALAERYRVSVLESALTSEDEGQQPIEVFGLAMIAGGLGRDEDAVRLEGAVETRWEELGIGARPRVLETWRERDLGAARARLGEARATALYEEGRAMSWDRALALALGKTQND